MKPISQYLSRSLLAILLIGISLNSSFAQMSCDELITLVERDDPQGLTLHSFNSSLISKVAFHEITGDLSQKHYFAIVQFKNSYKRYIYQVSNTTKVNYLSAYNRSAGKAFWKYIEPFSSELDCSPKL